MTSTAPPDAVADVDVAGDVDAAPGGGPAPGDVAARVPAPSPPGDAPLLQERAVRPPSALGPFLVHLATFVGAGLVSGGIVHRPLDPGRYTLLLGVGAAVFLGATLVGEVVLARTRTSRGRLVRLSAGALLLALGTGMVAGGAQHFTDVPARAAVLVPTGLVVAWLGYLVRGEQPLVAALRSRATVVVLGLAAVVAGGLQPLAGSAAASSTGHGHGSAPVAGTPSDTVVPAPAVPAGPAVPAVPAVPVGPAVPAAPAVPTGDLQQQLRDLEEALAGLRTG